MKPTRRCRVAASSPPRALVKTLAGLGLALAALAACEGNSAPLLPGGEAPPPSGGPDTPLPALAGPHACSVTFSHLALYQAVKVPLLGPDGPVMVRNALVVEGRYGHFRAFVTLNGGAEGNARARLRLHSSAGVRVFDDTRVISKDTTEQLPDSGFVFNVPASEIRSDTAVSLELDLGNSCPGGGVTRFPAGDPVPLLAQNTGVIKLTLVPVRYDADGSGRMPDLSDAQVTRFHDAMMGLYPVQEVQVTVRETVASTISLTGDQNSWGSLLGQVRTLRATDRAAPDVYYYAVVSPAATFQSYCRNSCTAGISYLVADNAGAVAQQVGVGIGFGGPLAAETLVHEVGHQHGRLHTNCGGGKTPDESFPFADGRIGVWGYDMYSGLYKGPITVKDFMGYCNPQWISDYTFNALATRIASVQTRAKVVQAVVQTEAQTEAQTAPAFAGNYRTLLVEGDRPGAAVQWGGLLDASAATGGQAEAARVLDASGAVVANITIFRNRYGHGDGASFDVPEAQAGWHSLALTNGQVIRYARAATIPPLRALDGGPLLAPVGGQPGSLRR